MTRLARPGGNVTGVVSVINSLAPERIKILRGILPTAKRIGFVGDPKDPRMKIDRNALAPVTVTLGLAITMGEASNPAEFDAAVVKLIGRSVDVIDGIGTLATNLRGRLTELANHRRLPVIGHASYMIE